MFIVGFENLVQVKENKYYLFSSTILYIDLKIFKVMVMRDYDDEYEDDDLLSSLIGAGAAILLGMAGAAILDSLAGYRCPHCKKKIEKNSTMCRHCHSVLRWQ